MTTYALVLGQGSVFSLINIPTLLVFKNGEIVDKQVGATSKQVLAAKLDGAM